MRAVIDIGSNSVRLMIDRGQALNEKKLATTRLGGGLSLCGAIDERAFAASVEAVARFADEARGADVYVFATEAVRAAANGGAFCRAVFEATGLAVDVIDGETEAKIAYLGAGATDGAATVIDAGGASTEITTGWDGAIERSVSVKVGAVRLHSLGLDEDGVRAHVKGLLVGLPPVAERVLAIGGTATALAAADLRLPVYDARAVHGHRLTRDAVAALVEAFRAGDIVRRFPAVSPARAEIILCGALLYEQIMETCKIPALTVSETDNCEGYLLLQRQRDVASM